VTWEPFETAFADTKMKFIQHAQIAVTSAHVESLYVEKLQHRAVQIREEQERQSREGDLLHSNTGRLPISPDTCLDMRTNGFTTVTGISNTI
jgi:hypothetical protein